MQNRETIKSQITAAFADVPFPGDGCLRGSNEGDEPYRLELEFKGKCDWQSLDPAFIDQAPDGYGSALSFFSDRAFRFYLPAYLIADIDGRLRHHDPVFHLTHGFTDRGERAPVNPLRYGQRTWFEAQCGKFSSFNNSQVAAIVAYLRLKREMEPVGQEGIDQALNNYWLRRADKGES